MHTEIGHRAFSNRKVRRLMQCGNALPLVILAVAAHADPILQQSASDITVTADSASGTPVAVELSSSGGAVTANVTASSGTTLTGDRDYVVGLETLTNGSITGTFGSITATGTGEVLGLGANSYDGDISLDVGTIDVDGVASAGLSASSENGNVSIAVDSAISRGTGEDSLNNFHEAVYGSSNNGSVTIDVGSAESFGTLGSAIGAVSGGTASITADSATIHGANTVAVYAQSAGNASVSVGTVTNTAENGQGVYLQSGGGAASLTADAIAVGDFANGARLVAAGDITVDLGSMTAGSGLRTEANAGNTSITAGSIDAFSFAVNALANAGGDITIDAGSLSSSIAGTGTAVAHAFGGGDITISADEVTGAGTDRGTIEATTDSGNIAIDAGSVSASGDAGVGVIARSTDGDIAVAVDTVATTGLQMLNNHTPDGVYAETTNGIADVTIGSGSVQGYAASAVVALGGAGASIQAGEASAAGQFVAVLYAGSSAGDATVNAGTVTLRGDQQAGINAIADHGLATVTVDAIVNEGTQATGVFARGGSGVSITSGTVATDGYGVWANALNGSTSSIVTTGDTTVSGGFGLRANGGAVSITTGPDTVTEAGTNAIWAQATQSATIDNQGTARQSGLGSAIFAQSNGSVSITSAVAEVGGAGVDPGIGPDGLRVPQGGIVAIASGPVTIDADQVTVAGEFRYGIFGGGAGGVTINADNVSLESADSVAVAGKSDTGAVSITTGTVTTTGASGIGVFGHTNSTGNVTINAGTTRVENAGMQGQFTGDAVVATSNTGNISITSADAFTAGYAGSAVVGISYGNVTLVSDKAETTGDDSAAILGQSNSHDLSIDAASVITSGANSAAVQGFAFQGTSAIRVGDVTATGANALGVTSNGRFSNITVDGTVDTTSRGVTSSAGLESHVIVNGSVTSHDAAGIVSIATHGVVSVEEGASVQGAGAGVVLLGNQTGGFSEFYNSGTVTGGTGPAVFGGQNDPNFPAASFVIQNNGTLSSGGQYVVVTGAGNDTFELTNRSIVNGIADLGGGDDTLLLSLNDDAPAGAVGQVAATVNVEQLEVSSGSWLAMGEQSGYDGVTIAEGATLTVGENADGDTAISTPHVALGGTLNLDFVTDTLPGDLTGLTIDGAGSLHLVGAATILADDASGLQHAGGTFVENGELLLTDLFGGDVTTSGSGVFKLGDGGTTGDFTGDLVNNGSFVFDRSDSYSFLGDFSGSGSLVKDGAGKLTFAGLYAFTGTTLVNGGSVAFTGQLDPTTELDLTEGTVDLSQVSGGEQTIANLSGDSGSLVLGSTSLTINQDSNSIFGGSITGDGTLTKSGDGDLKLNGDSTFSGTANVEDGTLSVNGAYQDATFFVDEGGKLGGNGIVGDTTIQGGTLGAGNSIGHLTVNGDLTFTAGSVLDVEVDPAGNADLVDVTGVATLGGATVNVLAGAGTYAPVTDYTILTADGGISGTFGAVHTNLAYLVPLLSYTVDTVTLRLSRNDVDFSAYAATANQASIGNLIESLGFGTPLYNTTLLLSKTEVPGDFETLTGGIYPTYGSALVETAEMVRRQTMQPRHEAAGAYVWGTGILGEIDGDGRTGIAGFKADNQGIAGGLGYSIGGFDVSVGVGQVWQDPSHSQIGDSDVTFAALQAAFHSPVGLTATAGLQAGWVDAASNRNTTLGTISDQLQGAFEGDYVEMYGEVSFTVPSAAISIEPFAGISHVSLNVDQFSESGGATALTVGNMDREVTFGDLGLRLALPLPGGIAPYVNGSYRHAWGDRDGLATVGFSGNSTGGTIVGLPIASDAAQLSAGLRYHGGGFDLDLGYNGSFSKTFDSSNFKLTASLHF